MDGLEDFRALNDPAERRRVERAGGYFVVEGVLAIERLLATDGWTIRSFALLPRVAERLGPLLPAGVPVAVVSEDELRAVVGFDLHRGALASVERRPPAPAADLVPGARLVVALQAVNDHENLGSIYRNAAAFGASTVLVDPACADPFYRRSVRVSLGHVLAVPTATYAGATELADLGITVVALTPTGEVDLADLEVPDGPVALLLGAEGPGLDQAALDAAHHRVRIPMAPGVDSINVAAASAVALHHLAWR